MANFPNYTDIATDDSDQRSYGLFAGLWAFGRHRETWYLYVDRAEVVLRLVKYRVFQSFAAEGDIGGGGERRGRCGPASCRSGP